MPRCPDKVREADITRAIRAVMKTGLSVSGIHIDGSTIHVLTLPAPIEQHQEPGGEDWLGKLDGKSRNGRASQRP